MSHELNTITFEIIKTDANTNGLSIDEARKTIIATGSNVASVEGIANAIEYMNNNGFVGTVVRFITAQGKMELDGKAFLMWGSRMARLVSA